MSKATDWTEMNQWLVKCVTSGYERLARCVTIDPEIRGGVPVLNGTRFTVAQTFVELVETSGVRELAEKFDIDPEVVRDMLIGLSLVLQRPAVESLLCSAQPWRQAMNDADRKRLEAATLAYAVALTRRGAFHDVVLFDDIEYALRAADFVYRFVDPGTA